jgi:acyl carrier protein
VKDLESLVRTYVASEFGIDESRIKSDSRLVEDLGASSMDVVSLLIELEHAFCIEFPLKQADHPC